VAKPTFTGGRASTRLWRSHHWATGGWFLPHQMPIAEMPNRGQQVLPFQLAQITSDLPGMGWVGDARAVVDGVEVSVTVPLASPATLDPTHAQEERCAVLFEQSVLKLLRTETRWLSDSPLVAGSRSWGAACARVVTERRQRQHAAARKRRPAAPRDCLACHRPSRCDRTTLLPPLCSSICQPGVRSACSTLISIISRCALRSKRFLSPRPDAQVPTSAPYFFRVVRVRTAHE
jgi:hypothetical protein